MTDEQQSAWPQQRGPYQPRDAGPSLLGAWLRSRGGLGAYTMDRPYIALPAAALAITLVVTFAISLSSYVFGPHYRHGWCTPVETTISAKHITYDAYQAQLRHAHNPLALQLAQDDFDYHFVVDQANTAPATQALSLLNAETRDLRVVGNDLRAIDRACGVPASRAGKQDS